MADDFGFILERLERLREGADFTLFRGRKRGNQVPILAVGVAAEQSSPQSLRRLEHEYSLRTALDPAWAAQPLALTRHQGRSVLIVKDPGGEFLDQVIEQRHQRIDQTRFLRMAIGLAVALSHAHRQGFIHKDIKPANALVDDSGHVWLTGFGIASQLPRDRQSPEAPEFIAGSLPYMAPEQTGRMNRSIDSRSDLYSMGVTLYEMSTGRLPFNASDPMEWVHCQIARQPVPPSDLTPNIGGLISAIIMKLLAKTPEERYQTAVGVERDLRRCLEEWETHGRIDEFPLGAHDKPDRLLIPEKLYGRTSEINTLLASFERVVNGGRPELVLVSGYSGVGKSSVVNELHKPLVPPRGLFASGKFDQYKRDIPYATLAQAFQSLIRPILAKNEEELGRWRDAIREALGPNGQLIVDLVPELKLIIGEQPAVPELPPQDAQNRFQLVFRRFIGALTRDHPLALFLDDLQWLDAATLDLMEDLLTHADVKDLMLIGAYRDNEVGPAHPLIRRLQSMRQAGAIVQPIILAPLTRYDLEQLIADALHCEPGDAGPLAGLVEEKTTGNPFFAIQFIAALSEEGLLTFDHVKARWCWDVSRIRAKGYTDNVVDLMVGKLMRLPGETQKALQQLACLGNKADFARLRMVYGDTIDEMHGQLWEAVRAGLVFRSEDSYSFLHDRVQEAAYSLIPQELRAAAHLRIGMLMASRASQSVLEEIIFEIVHQLNRGAHLVRAIAESERIARLNLIAGRRAKASTAYASALNYLHVGRGLLTDETWSRDYDLIFSIEYLLAECEVLTADMSTAEARLSALAKQATGAHHIALVARLRMTLYNLLDRSERGVDVFIDYERDRGKDWSPHPTDDEVSREFDQIRSLVETGRVKELVDLPLASNADQLDALDVFTEAVISATYTDENLFALVLCRMVSISLEYGNCDASCFAYAMLGMIAGPYFGNYEAGFQFGKLGYELVEKRGVHRYQARVYLRFGNQITPWRRHVKEGRELVRRAFDAANGIGDVTFAAYSRNNLNSNLLFAGDHLTEVLSEAEDGLEFAKRVKFGRVIDQIETQLAFIRTLRGLTDKFGEFNDAHFDELRFESHVSSNANLVMPQCWYWIRKLQARFFAGDCVSAIHASLHAKRLLWSSQSYLESAEYHFYSALARAEAFDSATETVRAELAEAFDSATETVRAEHAKALSDHGKQLATWAENCPENFEDRAALVDAEIARIEGRDLDAMRLYEKAMRSARTNGFIHNEALANELAGRFYLARSVETVGYTHIRNARNCYDRWGAIGKVKQLNGRYSSVRQDRTPAPATAISESAAVLDVETVVKASQALSSEMLLPELIEKLVRITIEHAGAQRGLLLLIRADGPRIEAEAITCPGRIAVVARREPVTPFDLPQSVLNYVIRTQQSVLLDDAFGDNIYCKDEYIERKRAKAVLCLPIVSQKKLVGALYLENNLAPYVFTPDRVAVLHLLASQAAISLENAALYANLQRSEAFLAQGQRISRAGTFGLNIATGDMHWSEEYYNILEYDRSVQPSLERSLARIHPDDRDVVGLAFSDAIRELRDYGSEHRLLMPDGRVKNVRSTGRVVNSEGLDFVGAVHDITERVRAAEALRQAQGDLARINRVTTLGELAGSLAHELSQPISGVMTTADVCLRMLEYDNPNVDEVRTSTARMLRDAQRAGEIIRRIRSQFEKGVSSREFIDANENIRETVALLRDEAARYNISINVDLAADLPGIIGDRVQLQQVVMNLILNGIEAMRDVEGVRKMVIKSERIPDEQVCLSVSDTGIGLPSQLVDRIFEPFFTTKPHGTGMGLRISRSIVESHGGRLWAVDSSGRGATFHVTLPAAVPRSKVRSSEK
jgi:predicted ATPase/signal transduction histidine kinase